MPKEVTLTEQDWNDFLQQLPIWERRWIYKCEMMLHDRVEREEIELVDIIDAINKGGDRAVTTLAESNHSDSGPASLRLPAEPGDGDALVEIIDRHKQD